MTRWVATAPGKVVLLGEYAVLEGAPALVQAVDRRCRVVLADCDSDACRVEAPQLGMPPARFEPLADGRVRWHDAPAGAFTRTARLIESSLAQVVRLGGRVRPFSLHIDTAALFHDRGGDAVKLGLGSSAASAVAVDAVLRAAFVGSHHAESPVETVRRLLIPVREAQGGAGSGIDLAASVCGGLSAYRLCDGAVEEVRRVSLPAGLALQFVWAGEPASTADLLGAWRAARAGSAEATDKLVAAMKSAANAGMAALERGDGPALLAAWSDYGRIMGKMNRFLDREVETPEHRIAASLAELLGGAYKPCGAGGGDLGLAASADPAFGQRLRVLCRQAGLTVLPIGPDESGVSVHRE